MFSLLGSTIQKIAMDHGLDAEDLWNHPANESLRRQRSDPGMLVPGDVVRLPAEMPKGPTVQPGTTSSFRARVPLTGVSLELRQSGVALGGVRYIVQGLPRGFPEIAGESTPEGRIEFEVPVNLTRVDVILVERNVVMPVFIGGLRPPEQREGAFQRLRHLGHYPWRIGADAPPRNPALDALAIRTLQTRKGAEATGDLDEATREALVADHYL